MLYPTNSGSIHGSMKKFILQAVTAKSHLEEVRKLLEIDMPNEIIISTAYMREAGLVTIGDKLTEVAHLTKIFVGIRNGVTTAQALKKALTLGCTVYAVDTGTSKKIFHPKMYFGLGEESGEIIIGSANLTLGGLQSNIEASILESLDLTDENDMALVNEIKECYRIMISDYPENVYQITCDNQINTLLFTGRVTDESSFRQPLAFIKKGGHELDSTPKMNMQIQAISLPTDVNEDLRRLSALEPESDDETQTTSSIGRFKLVWESKPLTRRDLNIPNAANTNPTGSMLWKKGISDVDQQKYFREKIFDVLEWKPDPKNERKEQAEANFIMKIRGIGYGSYKLTVTNDTRTDTKSYAQSQPMSAVRWGPAITLIAKDDLLGRTLRLFANKSELLFMIEID